jgi:predicted RNA polymerase sigma factor
MRGDLDAARAAVAALGAVPAMSGSRYYHAACAEISARTGRFDDARRSYGTAMRLAGERDRGVLARRLARLEMNDGQSVSPNARSAVSAIGPPHS